MKRLIAVTLLSGIAISCCWAIMHSPPVRNTQRLDDLRLNARFGFEPNLGQAGRQFDFVARGRDYSLGVSSHELVLTYFEGFGDVDEWFRDEVVRLKIVGAQGAAATGEDLLPGKSVFKLRADIPNYERVVYQHIYPGIDLVYSGDQGRLELQFVIGKGGDPEMIRLAWNGVWRARVEPDGKLALRTPIGEIELLPPISYDRFDGSRQTVPGCFKRLRGSRATFQSPR
ncbi:MAG TPA: hypothetical protein VJN43_07255 [Bryobacteraceae bacterium]|nr:hypothetical protein [Bryobacteraceae bacterium]